jgi:hypothetical protein
MINLQQTVSYLSVGMKTELVLSEEKRNQRFAKSISLKKMKIDSPGLMVKSSKRPIKSSEVCSVKPIVSVSPMIFSNSSSPITSVPPFSLTERIQELSKPEMCSIPNLPLNYENIQNQSNNQEKQSMKKQSIDKISATVGRNSVIVNKPSATATVDIQCCGAATSVIKMARYEHELSIRKEENIPVDTDHEMQVVDISQEDVNPLKEKNVIIENPSNVFYLHTTKNGKNDEEDDTEIKDEKDDINMEGEFSKSHNEEEDSIEIRDMIYSEIQNDSKTVHNVQLSQPKFNQQLN